MLIASSSPLVARDVLAPGSPMHVPVRIAAGAGGEPMQQRASCCLAHRTPAKLVCVNCPRAHRLDGRAVVGSVPAPVDAASGSP